MKKLKEFFENVDLSGSWIANSKNGYENGFIEKIGMGERVPSIKGKIFFWDVKIELENKVYYLELKKQVNVNYLNTYKYVKGFQDKIHLQKNIVEIYLYYNGNTKKITDICIIPLKDIIKYLEIEEKDIEYVKYLANKKIRKRSQDKTVISKKQMEKLCLYHIKK